MSEKPPFDPVKASFYLIASILWVHCIVVLAGVGACLWAAPDVIAGRFECDKSGKLTELLAAALSASLAFAGGYARRKDNE